MVVVANSRVLAAIFFATLIVAFAFARIPALTLGYMLLALGVIATNLGVFADTNARERNAALWILIVLTVMLPISAARNETAILHYIVALTSLAAALVFTRNLRVYLWASGVSLMAAQLAICVYLARTGLTGFPLEDMLPASSSNGVTAYLVLLQANYCLISYLYARRTALITCAVTLFVCFVGWTRGSILASAALLSIGLLFKVSTRSGSALALRLALVACCALLPYGVYTVISDLLTTTKLGLGLYDESRLSMIHDYLERIDWLSLWTGASYLGTSIAVDYNSNPHNSLIRAHHIFGLPYLLTVLLLPLYLIRKTHAARLKWYAGAIGVVVLFRCATEPDLFPTPLDFFYFASCFALSQELRGQEGSAGPVSGIERRLASAASG